MRPMKIPPPGREWKLLYLNVSICFVYFVFVFFVFLNVRLCLGERGNKNVRCRKLLLSESREGNALPPNYLYRHLSILHTLDCSFIFLHVSTHFVSIVTVSGQHKNWFFTVRLNERGGGLNLAVSKYENFDPFFSTEYDSMTSTTHFISLCFVTEQQRQ